MSTRRCAVIANPVKIDLARLRELLAEFAPRYGYAPATMLETTAASPGSEQARRALADGFDLILVAGGDGTVRAVVDALAGSNTPLGIIPAGTGNLLARNLGMVDRLNRVFSVEQALAVAFGGTQRRIDLGEVELRRPDGSHERRRFSVIAGLGIDAGMIEHTDEQLKSRFGWLAYGSGIVKWLVGSGAFHARYRIAGGRTWGTRASSILIANAGVLPGGVTLLPDAKLDDGLLDVLVLRPRGPLGWAMIVAAVVARTCTDRSAQPRTLSYLQGREVLLRIDSGPQQFELDGDADGQITALRAYPLPDALLVRVPAAAVA